MLCHSFDAVGQVTGKASNV